MAAGKHYNSSLRMAHYLRRKSRDARRMRMMRLQITAREMAREMAEAGSAGYRPPGSLGNGHRERSTNGDYT